MPDRIAFARELAHFLRAFWAVDTAGGPPAGVANFHRGGELAVYGAETAACIDALAGRIDADGARRVWAEAIASRWSRPPVWVHGDVAVGNLLVEGGRLSAVIDFGGLAVGDPACDLVIAWLFLDAESRAKFRAELALDDDTWARARGWALWKALLMASQGKLTHPAERAPLDVVALVIAD